MDWKSVAEKIIQDDQNKWEQTWLAEELEVYESRASASGRSQSTHSMTRQFCQKLDIPVRYFKRLPDEMKMTVANFDLQTSQRDFVLCPWKGRMDTRVSFGGVCRLQ